MPPYNRPPAWFRSRRYLHFDRPLGVTHATKIVRSPKRVSRHAFYPLIRYQIVSKKIRKAADGSALETKVKERDIAYAAHVDAHIYSYYAKLLEKRYEGFLSASGLSDCVLAFRALGKSNIEFAAEAFAAISARRKCAAVALDVSGFFDNLDHEILKQQWCRLLKVKSLPGDHYNIFKSLTRFATVDRAAVYSQFGISRSNPKLGRKRICSPEEFRTRVRGSGLVETNRKGHGIPQGTPISSILSNIYMMDFDRAMNDYARKVGGVYLRYCDDILFIVPVPKRNTCAGEAQKNIRKQELEINIDKTVLCTFTRKSERLQSDKPLQYLGFTFDGQQILIRSAAFARYSNNMKRAVRLAKATRRRWNGIRADRGADAKDVYRRKLYQKYSHLGRRNFVIYGYRAAKIMKSPPIRGQLKPLWQRLLREIEEDT